jgi:hypothetical protein
VTEPEVRRADVILRRQGIPYVVVGGQAVAREAATATHDVDVLVATADFDRTVERLRSEAELVFDWSDDKLARFRIRPLGGVPLDILNAVLFSGNRGGVEFFDYLIHEASTVNDGIAYATPEMVWYTRLLTKRWKAYAEKIVTNVIDGVAATRLAGVDAIARHFGTEVTIKTRIAYVRVELMRPDIRSLIPANRPDAPHEP